MTKKVAVKYCLATIISLGMHGLLGSMGAIDLVFPNLPIPIPYNYGRAMHLNQAVYWPMLGSLGAAYYFLVKETKTDLHSVKIANFQFWLLIATLVGNYMTLLLGFSSGREYLEALFPFKLAILLGLLLFIYNVTRTIIKKPFCLKPVPTVIIAGVLLSIMLYIPNMVFIHHPVLDDMVSFWVIHLWEESTLELVLFVVMAGVMLEISGVNKKFTEKLLLAEAGLVVLSAFMSVGHHYYWNGSSRVWHYVGSIFSAVQVLPVVISVWLTVEVLKTVDKEKAGNPGFKFILGSVFWNIVGVAILGFVMAVPQINRYVHGTYLTSTHAHLALFGMFGQGVIGACAFILSQFKALARRTALMANMSFWLLNVGLAIMAIALTAAGLAQSFLGHVAGIDFAKVHLSLNPYLLVRWAGGIIFAAGGVILTYAYVSHFIVHRKFYISKYQQEN